MSSQNHLIRMFSSYIPGTFSVFVRCAARFSRLQKKVQPGTSQLIKNKRFQGNQFPDVSERTFTLQSPTMHSDVALSTVCVSLCVRECVFVTLLLLPIKPVVS